MNRTRAIYLTAGLAALACAAYGADGATSLLPPDAASVFKLRATRGFLGDYEIEAKAGGKPKTVRVSLPKGGATVECVLQ